MSHYTLWISNVNWRNLASIISYLVRERSKFIWLYIHFISCYISSTYSFIFSHLLIFSINFSFLIWVYQQYLISVIIWQQGFLCLVHIVIVSTHRLPYFELFSDSGSRWAMYKGGWFITLHCSMKENCLGLGIISLLRLSDWSPRADTTHWLQTLWVTYQNIS